MLQYVWLNLPDLWRWQDIRILHYQYEKPWREHAKSDALRVPIDLWRAHAGDGPVPDPREQRKHREHLHELLAAQQ